MEGPSRSFITPPKRFCDCIFAHVDFPECPWLGMSSSTDFAKCKAQVGTALEEGFNREDIAVVFLGGRDPEDAEIKMGKNKFNDTVDAN